MIFNLVPRVAISCATKYCNVRSYCKASPYLENITVLGVETSCDDTGIAVVNGKGDILGESLYSQNVIHLRYGGVNPIVAHELHRDSIEEATDEALRKSNLNIENIDAIAVTTKPGLLMSLQIGVKYSKYLAKKYQKPIIPIHHMEAHALVARMDYDIPFPYIVLLISGGHCLLCVVRDVDDFLLLGESLDNAPGEVLDKVARRMKLRNIQEYSQVSGGRAVELAAKKATEALMFDFPLPLWKYRDCNFSFSGLKDSLVRKLILKEIEHGVIGDRIIPEVNNLCASFQIAMAEHMSHRVERGILFSEKQNLINDNSKNIVVSGGVACNDFIFKSIEYVSSKMGYKVFRPKPKLCTDNGVMIAWNGIEKFVRKCDLKSDISMQDINPNAPLGRNIINEVKAANIPVKVTRLKKLFDTYY